MTSLLYHWNFTGANDLVISGDESQAIYDSESNLVAKVKRRGTYSSSSVSRGDNGITLNNNDSTNGGYYIELDGLNTTSLGGNLSIEMALQNHDRTYKGLYFSSTNAQGQTTSQGATIVARFNNKVKLLSRPDSTSNVSYNNYRNVNESSATVVNSNNEFHYIFTVHYDSSSSSLKIYINGDKKGEHNADLEGVLTSTVRGSNLIGTQKEQLNATYLNGVVKYLKIYQNSMSDSEATTTYNNYNNAPYYADISSGTNQEKFTRRHTTVDTYFTDNPSITSFTMTGNQLGLSNSTASYNIHKFVNEGSISLSSGYHYVPLEGQNQFVIFKNGTDWYKITQTSANSNAADARYKYEISNNNGTSYSAAVTDKTFGQSFTDSDITITFGGAEAINNSGICILEGSYITTDQGDKLIENLTTDNTIYNMPILNIYRSLAIQKFVCIKKNSFGNNLPNRDTYLSNEHMLYDRKNDLLRNSSYFIDENNVIQSEIDKNKYCYHILLPNWCLIKVNNLDCESLCCLNKKSINFYKDNLIYKESFIDILKRQSNKIVTTKDIMVKGNKILFKKK